MSKKKGVELMENSKKLREKEFKLKMQNLSLELRDFITKGSFTIKEEKKSKKK